MPSVEIRVKGRIDERWSEWFADLDETVLSGPVVDQAALYGVLSRLRDLGLPLVSVRHLEDGEQRPSGSSSGGREG